MIPLRRRRGSRGQALTRCWLLLDNRIETRSLVANLEATNHSLHPKPMGTKSLALYIISIAKVMKIHTKPRKVPDLDTPIITKSLVGVSIDMNKSRTQSRKALLKNKGNKDPTLQGSLHEVDESTTSSTKSLRALRKGKEEPPNAFPPLEVIHKCHRKWTTRRSVAIQAPSADL